MRHFNYRSLNELRQSADALGARHVVFEESPDRIREILARKVAVGPVTVGNSIAIHPTAGLTS